MADQKLPEELPDHSISVSPDAGEPPLRVLIDPSSPSIRSIARVVVITLFLLLVAGYIQQALSSLSYLFFLVVLSIFFAYLLDPLVNLIRRPFKERGAERYMPRSLAIVITYIFVFTVLGVVISNLAPRVVNQAREFGQTIPEYGSAFRERASELNQRFKSLQIPEDVQTKFNDEVVLFGQRLTASIGGFLLALATYLPWLLLVPVLAFFMLKDVNRFRLAVLRAFPVGRTRYRAELILQDVNNTIAAYTRAQLISCLLIGMICTIGFYLLGLKYALLLGIMAGVLEFVPMLGPALTGVIVISTAAFSDDPWKALYVAIFLIVLRIIHDYVTYPKIVHGGIHLHPLIIILSVIGGELVAGIPGVFFSIPVVATLIVILKHILEHRGRRNLLSGWIEEDATAGEQS